MSQVLLLNATYEPLRVISTRRAICLILSEKAEVLEEAPGRFRSASTEVAVPLVIRLRRFVQIPFTATIPLNRRALLARDRGECQVSGCGRAGTTVDHVHPRSRGGKHRWENVVAMCSKHNFEKADLTLDEIGWTLKSKPYAPTGTKWLFIGIGVDPQESWVPYLPDFVPAGAVA